VARVFPSAAAACLSASSTSVTLALRAYTHGNGLSLHSSVNLPFGATAERGGHKEVYFVEQTGGLASIVSWLVFEALAVPAIGEWLGWRVVGYATLSLAVVRMLPGAASDASADKESRLASPPCLAKNPPCGLKAR
jgi:hypothetical protein